MNRLAGYRSSISESNGVATVNRVGACGDGVEALQPMSGGGA